MATRKGSRGPRIRTYILKVNEQTGEILQTLTEHPVTGERKIVKVSPIVGFGLKGKRKGGDSSLPMGPVIPINRLGMTNLLIRPVVTPDPPPELGRKRRR